MCGCARPELGSLLDRLQRFDRRLGSQVSGAAICWNDSHVRGGGLMSYGPNSPALHHASADYVDRILKGAKPVKLPVQAPTQTDLTINLKTAAALGITIPQSVLLQAKELIR
jgi:putative tryptophan/tyrosine transport system substrate-binding protein